MKTLVSNNIAKAIAILQTDGVVAVPTETVYGLAGNIFSETAIKKIFAIKKRPLFNPLIIHLHNVNQLDKVVASIPLKAQQLAEAFWPGPLTLVLPKKEMIPDLVTAGKSTVAVRVPNHPLLIELLEQLNFPLAAPSANPFGSISPTMANHVKKYFDGKLEMILDGGACRAGIESTIVGFKNNQPIIYRLGSIALEDIEQVVGTVHIQNRSESKPVASGMMSRHYAPNKPTFFVEDIQQFVKKNRDKKLGVLVFENSIKAPHILHQEVLSFQGDLAEATSELYAALHRLDKTDAELIGCQQFPNKGLGKTINDRLKRAAKQF